jgi:hypothetical protein
MREYGLGFISDEDLFAHVSQTVEQYRFSIDLKQFNKNLIDPIKLTFDTKVYGKTLEEIIEAEIIRQVDKSNTNHIGYFHQNIFKYIGQGWSVPDQGFDLINEEKKIYVEMKNKHNTMNSSSSQRTYIKMQGMLLKDAQNRCMLVEVIAKKSQNIPWQVSVDGMPHKHEFIRRVSIDRFYELVTREADSFKRLCEVFPLVLDDVMAASEHTMMTNTVFADLEGLSPDLLKSLYLLAFEHYDGFGDFNYAG